MRRWLTWVLDPSEGYVSIAWVGVPVGWLVLEWLCRGWLEDESGGRSEACLPEVGINRRLAPCSQTDGVLFWFGWRLLL